MYIYQRWLSSPHHGVAWELPLVFLDGLRGGSLRCRGGHQCKLIPTLRIPLAPSFVLGKSLENLLFPLVISYMSICPKGRWLCRFWMHLANDVITHVKIKGCCKSETFKLLQYHVFFGIGKGFLTNLLLTSQKLLRKCTVLFFFGTIKDGDAHSE